MKNKAEEFPELEFCNHLCEQKKRNEKYPPCGCGKTHQMLPFAEFIVHWQGQHWVLECLTEHLSKKQKEDKEVILLLRKRMHKMHKDISSLPCEGAKIKEPHSVGKKYRIRNKSIYCLICSQEHELGGEG